MEPRTKLNSSFDPYQRRGRAAARILASESRFLVERHEKTLARASTPSKLQSPATAGLYAFDAESRAEQERESECKPCDLIQTG